MAVLFDSRFLGPTEAAVVSSLIVLSFMRQHPAHGRMPARTESSANNV
jgi:hypothetical protein